MKRTPAVLDPNCALTWSADNPYPVKVFHPFLSASLFAELRDQFPPRQEMKFLGGVGHKWTINNGKGGDWDTLVEARPVWGRLFSDGIENRELLDFAKEHFSVLVRAPWVKQKIETSLMPAEGGNITPHPDNPKKLVTLVIYLADDDWQQEWGGQFAMVIPKVKVDPTQGYPRVRFSDAKVFHEVPFLPNTAVFMERTPQSFHAVFPMRAPEGRDRRTITVNFMGRGY